MFQLSSTLLWKPSLACCVVTYSTVFKSCQNMIKVITYLSSCCPWGSFTTPTFLILSRVVRTLLGSKLDCPRRCDPKWRAEGRHREYGLYVLQYQSGHSLDCHNSGHSQPDQRKGRGSKANSRTFLQKVMRRRDICLTRLPSHPLGRWGHYWKGHGVLTQGLGKLTTVLACHVFHQHWRWLSKFWGWQGCQQVCQPGKGTVWHDLYRWLQWHW